MKLRLIFIDSFMDPLKFIFSEAFHELADILGAFEFQFLESSSALPKIAADPDEVVFIFRDHYYSPKANGMFEEIRAKLIEQGCCPQKIIPFFLQDFPPSVTSVVDCPYRFSDN